MCRLKIFVEMGKNFGKNVRENRFILSARQSIRRPANILISFLILMAFTISVNAQTLTTDKDDYPPLSNAVFSGAGFFPNEKVVLKVKNLTQPCYTTLGDSSYAPWTVTADSLGNFVTNWTVCNCPSDSLRLKATGQTSGLIALAYFTDSKSGFTSAIVSGASTICSGSSTNLSLNVTTCSGANGNGSYTATYLWQQSPDNASWGTAAGTSTNSIYSASPTSSTYYRCIITITGTYQGCGVTVGNSYTTVGAMITVNQNPTSSNAGLDRIDSTTCGLTTITLAGNIPTIGTGTWSKISGGGSVSFSNVNSPTSTFSGTAGNTYTLRWTISNSPCTATMTDEVTVKFNQNPTTANAGEDLTGALRCGITTVRLDGNSPSVGTGTWSFISGTDSLGSFSDASNNRSNFTGTGGSNYTLRWTVSNSPCPSSTNDVIVTFNEIPSTSDAGPDQTGASTCGLTTVSLAGNSPKKGTGAWTIESGTGGSLSDASSRTSDFSGDAGSTYTLRWTITNSPCQASYDEVTIKFNINPTVADAGPDQTLCLPTAASLAANTPGTETGAWSVVSGPSLVLNQFSSTTNPTATFTPAGGAGNYSLRWTITNSPCTSSNDIIVTERALPLANIAIPPASPDTICSGETATIKITGTPNAIVTYNVDHGTNQTVTINMGGNAPLNPVLTNTTTYYLVSVAYSDNPTCSQSLSDSVTVTVNHSPQFTSCHNDTAVNTEAGLCSAIVNYNVSVSGTPTPTLSYTFSGATVGNGNGTGSGSTFNKGVTNVTITAHNTCSPDVTCIFNITVNDNEAPVLITQAGALDKTLQCSDTLGINAALAQAPSASDNCTASPVINLVSDNLTPDGSCANAYVRVRTWNFSDSSGNTSSNFVQTITVIDNTAPIITTLTGSLDSTFQCSDTAGIRISLTKIPGATDNCTLSPTINLVSDNTTPDGSCANAYIRIRTWNFSDGCNNISADFVQTITVIDNTAPVVTTTAGSLDSTLQCSDAAGIAAALAMGPIATDNCTTSPTINLVSDNTTPNASCANAYVRIRTWNFSDGCGNTSANFVQTITVNDTVKPLITPPATIIMSNNTGVCGRSLISTALGTPTVSDNCTASPGYSNNAPANFPVGNTTVTWTVNDGCGNTKTATQLVTINDTTKPTITCPSNISNVPYNAALCGASVVVPNPTIGDNCAVTCLKWVMTGATQGSSAATGINYIETKTFNFGTTTITYTAKDAAGNSRTCNFTVSVGKLTLAPTLTITPGTQQYSDKVTFTAVIPGGYSACGNSAATTVTFKVGTQIMGTVPLVQNGSSSDLIGILSNIALLEPLPFGTAPIGQMAPGNRTVTACFNNINTTNFILSNKTATLPITAEDARITYTGSMCVATSSATATSGTVTLSATIQDITATLEAAGDISFGDIRNAKITFVNLDNATPVNIATVNVGLVNPSDTKTGTAVYNWLNVPVGQHTVGIIVSNYYTRNNSNDNVMINVYQPNGDFITGGGYLLLTGNSNGAYKGDTASKNNFGFNVKYNKNGSNLQGNINTIIRRTEGGIARIYQVKGNAMTSLSVNPNITSSHPYATAVFNGKANITDITNPLSPLTVDGNATLQVTMTDKGEPGSSDMIGITVFNKAGGLWYSSNWNGTKTIEQILNGGNLLVHSSSSVSSSTGAQILQPNLNDSIDDDGTAAGYSLSINRPNPFSVYTIINYTLPEPSFVDIKVYDMGGKLVQTLVSKAEEAGNHEATWTALNFWGKELSEGIYFYTIQAEGLKSKKKFTQTNKMILIK
jgi:hypothetical protein